MCYRKPAFATLSGLSLSLVWSPFPILGKFPSGLLIIWGALPLEAGTHCCRCCHRIHTPGQRLPGTPPGNLAGQCSITTRFFLLVLDARGTLQLVRFPILYFGTIQLGNLTTLQCIVPVVLAQGSIQASVW